jgi:hypothetical protein
MVGTPTAPNQNFDAARHEARRFVLSFSSCGSVPPWIVVYRHLLGNRKTVSGSTIGVPPAFWDQRQ